MAFVLAGQIITQSGTDTDATTISGLQAIAGVTSISESGRTRLIIPYQLSITGTMTNTSAVAFTFSRVRTSTRVNEVTITSTGRWNYKESRTFNGVTDWRIMPPIIFTQAISTSNFNSTVENLIYVLGGIQDFAKVEIIGNGGYFWNGGTIIFRDVILNGEGLTAGNDQQVTTQAGNPTLDIDGLEFRGGLMFIQNAIITQLNRLKPKFVSRGFGTGFGLTRTLQDFDSVGAVFDISIYGGGASGVIRCNNPVKGGGITCGAWTGGSNGPNNEYFCTSDLVLTGVNESSQPVLFKAYHQDNNTSAPTGAGLTGTNYTLRKVYNQLSTSAGVATLNILLSAGLRDNPMVRRSSSQANDLYTFNCFSYLSQPTVTPIINLTGAGIKTATVTQLKDQSISEVNKAIVDAYTSLDTLDKVYDKSKSFLFDNFAGETATLLVANSTALNAGSKNILIDNTAVNIFSYNAGTNTVTIKSSVLSAGVKLKSLTTTGNVIITGEALSNITINGNVTQNTPTNLSNVTITGTLTYNTTTATPVTFTTSTLATVNNIGTGLVTVKRVNSTLTAGTNIVAYTPTTLNLTLNGGRIRILDNLGVEQFNQTTDGVIELPANATGVWTYRIAKYGSQLIENTFIIDGTTKNITASYIPDTFVVDTLANVQAYTELNSTQKIYDYQSYNLTTATGIVTGSKLSKSFGTINVTGDLVLNSTAINLFDYTSNILTVKTSNLSEITTIFSTGNFIQNTAIISNDVKIRAVNFDSEIVYNSDSLTFYPTTTDRDAGTNAGVTTTGGVYRYKFGAVYSGVTMTSPLNTRYTVAGTVSLGTLAITIGNFAFNLTTIDLLLQSNNFLRIVNANVMDGSILVPAERTF